MVFWLTYLWQIVNFSEGTMLPHKLECADEVIVALDYFNVFIGQRIWFLVELGLPH